MYYKKLFRIPFLFLRRLIIHIKQEINEYKYPYQKRYNNLINNYKLCGLDKTRESYIRFLNNKLKALDLPLYDESNGMYSEHLIIFSAIPHQILR